MTADVGLYRVQRTRVIDGRVYLVTSDHGRSVSGLVYCPSGLPSPADRLIDEPTGDLLCAPAADGWWYFEQHHRF